MGKYDDLYSSMQQINDMKHKQNFEYFMKGLEFGIIRKLDDIYASGEVEKYNNYVSSIKEQDIKVFRNNEGKHKVQFDSLACLESIDPKVYNGLRNII